MPFALDYAVNERIEIVLEPIVYSHVRRPNGTLASGLGDLELTGIFLAHRESPRTPGVAIAAEVKLPTAHRGIGSGRVDWTGDLVLSKELGSIDTHCNLVYTVVGQPDGLETRNVFGFSLAVERPFGRFDVLGEVVGHTAALAGGEPDGANGNGVFTPELGGEELAARLGARCHLSDRLSVSLGVGYDNDHAIRLDPGFSLKLR